MSNCFGRFYSDEAPECKKCAIARGCKVIQDNDMLDAPLQEKLFVILNVEGKKSAALLAKALDVEESEIVETLKNIPGVRQEIRYKIFLEGEKDEVKS